MKTVGDETLNRTWATGNLFKLSPIAPDGVVTPLTNFTGASVSDPAVSFDGKKILFSMRPPGGTRTATSARSTPTAPGCARSRAAADTTSTRSTFRTAGSCSPARATTRWTSTTTRRPSTSTRATPTGANLERISYNQSDDFDPELLPDGRLLYTRWEHFGTMNRFPLFFTNPDGTRHVPSVRSAQPRTSSTPTPTPDGRIIAIESTMVEGDAGPIAVLKLEQGPADPANGPSSTHWDVLTPQVNADGEPWPYGVVQVPARDRRQPLRGVVLAARRDRSRRGLRALHLLAASRADPGTPADPATFTVENLTFLYNDPNTNEYDAQLLAPHASRRSSPSIVDRAVDYGVFLAQDVFNRGTNDGQEVPVKGVDAIDSVAIIAARPTRTGEMNDFSANEFEKRALIGIAPVYPDGSFRIKVPANTPISFATLDNQGRGFVVKRTHLYVRPGEEFNRCVGCHEDRRAGGPVPTNPNPMAALYPAHDLNIPRRQLHGHQLRAEHRPDRSRPSACRATSRPSPAPTPSRPRATWISPPCPIPPMMGRIFPRAYVNLSGESMMANQEVVPPFPRRSRLIDVIRGLGSRSGSVPIPSRPDSLTAYEETDLHVLGDAGRSVQVAEGWTR